MVSKENQETIDRHLPYRGKCAFCGGDDARHRIFDAIRSCHAAGDSIADLADDYGFPEEFIDAVVQPDQPSS